MPVEPPSTRWRFPSPDEADEHGIVAVGADLEPGTLLAAYRAGLFPMRVHRHGPIAWWSPDPRGILPLDAVHVSRSLRRTRRRYEIRVDTAFEEVVRACADPRRPHGWIDASFVEAYTLLHRLGWAHSVEAWSASGELVGGAYGVAIGGFFAGESMFHRATDAGKAALVTLTGILREGGALLFDVQWTTPHLASLGAVDVPRREYLAALGEAIERPLPAVLGG
ncbi:MAG: leucyl/phenylalanyl-tRNA--protein transferase [Acidimicrobiia bacterium]|nr:leucyl/phenylalanyl-tRNA--protein transferase [Acidimicrobiia bacterium]